jgi:transcriptional regulator with XRE-family HTH domain
MGRRSRPRVKLEPTYLREWRKERGLILADVAEAIGMDATAISRLESGISPYDQFHLQELSKLYKVSIPELLYKDPRRPRPVDDLLRKAERLQDAEDIKSAIAVIDAFLQKEISGIQSKK